MGLLVPALAAAATAIGASGAAETSPYLDGPPPAHTGGFDEPTCRACHFDADLNEAPGAVALRGLPETLDGGTGAVDVTVELRRPGTSRGGFQLSARYADGPEAGSQAGGFEVDGRTAEVTREGDVAYVHHGPDGTEAATPGTLRWRIRWLPPERPRGAVAFHVAANAADDDASEFGDHIYTDRVTVAAAGAQRGSGP